MQDIFYLRAQYYAPRTGTFLSRDMWAGDANQPMSYNKWAYTNANPVNFTDPSGMISCENSDDGDRITQPFFHFKIGLSTQIEFITNWIKPNCLRISTDIYFFLIHCDQC